MLLAQTATQCSAGNSKPPAFFCPPFPTPPTVFSWAPPKAIDGGPLLELREGRQLAPAPVSVRWADHVTAEIPSLSRCAQAAVTKWLQCGTVTLLSGRGDGFSRPSKCEELASLWIEWDVVGLANRIQSGAKACVETGFSRDALAQFFQFVDLPGTKVAFQTAEQARDLAAASICLNHPEFSKQVNREIAKQQIRWVLKQAPRGRASSHPMLPSAFFFAERTSAANPAKARTVANGIMDAVSSVIMRTDTDFSTKAFRVQLDRLPSAEFLFDAKARGRRLHGEMQTPRSMYVSLTSSQSGEILTMLNLVEPMRDVLTASVATKNSFEKRLMKLEVAVEVTIREEAGRRIGKTGRLAATGAFWSDETFCRTEG